MKVMKKLVALVLTVAMLLTCLPFVYAESRTTITVGSGELSNETLTIPVMFKNYPTAGIGSVAMKFDYDKNNLKLKSISNVNGNENGLLTGMFIANVEEDMATWLGLYGFVETEGLPLFWLTFEKTENAFNGDYLVKIVDADEAPILTDLESNAVDDFDIFSGTITITGGRDPESLKPIIETDLQDVSYGVNEEVPELKVEAKLPEGCEDGTLSYQWYKDGAKIDGATSASYTPSGLAAGNSATYHCVVTNTVNSVACETETNRITVSCTKAQLPDLELSQNEFTYDGNEKKPTVTVGDLTEDTTTATCSVGLRNGSIRRA